MWKNLSTIQTPHVPAAYHLPADQVKAKERVAHVRKHEETRQPGEAGHADAYFLGKGYVCLVKQPHLLDYIEFYS